MKPDIQENEFSRIVATEHIPESGYRFRETADSRERAALGRRFDLDYMKRFSLLGSITPESKAGYVLEARLQAEYGQICVVSLTPIDQTMDVRFKTHAMTGDTDAAGDPNLLVAEDLISGELPFVIGSIVDLGECAVQYFAQHLDPYPRNPDAAITEVLGRRADRDEEKRDNPFKVLQKRGGES